MRQTLHAWRCRLVAAIPAIATLCVAMAGCGSSSANTPTTPSASAATTTSNAGGVTLSSTAVVDGGTLPPRYVCRARSGLSVETNPPLDWSAAPPGTVSFVLLMTTVAKDASGTTTKYNWVLYDIPASARSIPENNTTIVSGNTGTTLVGMPGLTSDGPQFSYSPPCSATGSGLRTYTFTVYALSARPTFTVNHVPGAGGDGANLAAAIAPLTLAKASLSTSFTF